MEFNEHFPLHEQPLLAEEELMETMAERALRMLRAGWLGTGDVAKGCQGPPRKLQSATVGHETM